MTLAPGRHARWALTLQGTLLLITQRSRTLSLVPWVMMLVSAQRQAVTPRPRRG